MILCIFYPRKTRRSDGLQYLFLTFPVWPFLRLVVETDYPPITFTLAFWHGCRLSIIGIFVLQGTWSNTLAFWKNIEVSAPFLRVSIQFFTSDVFGV